MGARRINDTPAVRFWAKVDSSGGVDGCWPWTASLTTSGYGRFGVNGRVHSASRWLIGQLTELIGADYVLHRCDNPPCCNPNHLYIGSQRDNVLDQIDRGRSARGRVNAAKTHCLRGHEYSPENTRHYKGSRACRACHAAQERERRHSRG